MNKIAKAIIFSKDRPLQLYATLESFVKQCSDFEKVDVFVLAKVSEETESAYSEIESEFCDFCTIVRESNFFTDLSKLLLFNKRDHVMFLVDDIVFKSKFRISDCIDHLNADGDCLTFSLRLGKGMNYCYSLSKIQAEPSLKDCGNGIFTFKHSECDGDWGYPFSVDGNVFRTEEFNELAFVKAITNFRSPNSFESTMSTKKNLVADRLTACFAEPKLLNVPDNRVQNEISNRSEKNSAERLLKEWNDGMKIDVLPFNYVKNNSCHFPYEFRFTKR